MITIKLDAAATGYAPGTEISGVVAWSDEQAEQLEIRLLWFTSGKGDRDLEIIASQAVDNPQPDGRQSFQFTLPNRPYSFSGKLISLIWTIEAITFPASKAERIDFTLSPSGSEIKLNPAGHTFSNRQVFARSGRMSV